MCIVHIQRLGFTWFGDFVPNFCHFIKIGNITYLYLMYHCIQYIEIKKYNGVLCKMETHIFKILMTLQAKSKTSIFLMMLC